MLSHPCSWLKNWDMASMTKSYCQGKIWKAWVYSQLCKTPFQILEFICMSPRMGPWYTDQSQFSLLSSILPMVKYLSPQIRTINCIVQWFLLIKDFNRTRPQFIHLSKIFYKHSGIQVEWQGHFNINVKCNERFYQYFIISSFYY